MPRYEIEVGGKRYEIEAADDQAASRVVGQIAGQPGGGQPLQSLTTGPRPHTSLTPPGTTPGNMAAKPGFDASMVPLSEEAQKAQRMMMWGAIAGNPMMEKAGERLWSQDPTAEARKKQAVDMGAAAAKRAEAQVAGENILRSYAKLVHRFNETPDDVLGAAVGPYATKPYANYVPMVAGMTPPEAAAAYSLVPRSLDSLAPGGPKSTDVWNTQNLFKHLAHGVTNAFVANAGKSANMSDARQQVFASAMEDFMKATDRKSAEKVLTDAKTIITNDFHVSPERASQVLKEEMARFASESPNKAMEPASRSASSTAAPGQAVDELIANAANPVFVESFNRHFNGGRPGLAEMYILSRQHGVPFGDSRMPTGARGAESPPSQASRFAETEAALAAPSRDAVRQSVTRDRQQSFGSYYGPDWSPADEAEAMRGGTNGR